MDSCKSCSDHLLAAEYVVQICLGVMGTGVAIALIIDRFKGAAVDGIG